MAFWSKWFGGGGSETPAEAGAVKSVEYKGYVIEARPFKESGQWQLAGRITRDGREHKFVRADKFSDEADAVDIAIAKGKLVVDQMGERMFG